MEHYTNFCDACSAPIQHNQLVFDISGGYGQFTDYVGDEDKRFVLCHDCILQMIALFPAMGAKFGEGCHPCDNSKPCCAFAWQVHEGAYATPSQDLQSWVPCYP